MKQGIFITFEGGEGSGKSTQINLLAQWLKNLGHDVCMTREPGGSDGAELIRALLVSGETTRWSPISEALLLSAARADHWQKTILPALQKGSLVLCDRFADSTLAYQGYAGGIDLAFLKQLYQQIIGQRQPDRTYIFDLDPNIGIKRAASRHPNGEDRFEKMDLEFHRKLRQGYLEIAKDNPQRCCLVDASQDATTIQQQIQQDIKEHFIG
jgi:dTMP kinase